MSELRDVEAAASIEADRHRPDEQRGGCTCGFCAWSVEHVGIMALRVAVEPLLSALAAEKARAEDEKAWRVDAVRQLRIAADLLHQAERQVADRDAKLAAVQAIHRECEHAGGEGFCCGCSLAWPCPTARAALSLSVPTSPQTDEMDTLDDELRGLMCTWANNPGGYDPRTVEMCTRSLAEVLDSHLSPSTSPVQDEPQRCEHGSTVPHPFADEDYDPMSPANLGRACPGPVSLEQQETQQ